MKPGKGGQLKSADTANLGGIVKDLKVKVTALGREIERVQKTIKDLESFPIIHQDLQVQVEELSRVLYYLEGQADRLRSEKSRELEMQILSADLKELVNLMSLKI